VVLVDEELRRDLPQLARFIATDGIERVYLPYAALQPLADSVATAGLDYRVKDVMPVRDTRNNCLHTGW